MLQIYHYHTSPEKLIGYDVYFKDSEEKAKKWRETVKRVVLDLNGMANIYDSEVAAEKHEEFGEISITFNDLPDEIVINVTKNGKLHEDVGRLMLEYSPTGRVRDYKMLMIVGDELLGVFDLGNFWGTYEDEQVAITEMQDELYEYMQRVRVI